MEIIAKLLSLLFWFGVAFLLLITNRIARFYELTTGVRSYHEVFWLPAVLFVAAMARYLIIDPLFAGDVLGDTLFFLGGITLCLVGYYLLKLMTGGRP